MKKILSYLVIYSISSVSVCAKPLKDDVDEAFLALKISTQGSLKSKTNEEIKEPIVFSIEKIRPRDQTGNYLKLCFEYPTLLKQEDLEVIEGYAFSVVYKDPKRPKEAMGFLRIAILRHTMSNFTCSYLDEVHFEPHYQGVGMGTHALNFFNELSDNLKCTYSVLKVLSDNPYTASLYQKSGFGLTSRTIRKLEEEKVDSTHFFQDSSSSRKLGGLWMKKRRIQTTREDAENIDPKARRFTGEFVSPLKLHETPKKLAYKATGSAQRQGQQAAADFMKTFAGGSPKKSGNRAARKLAFGENEGGVR